MKRMGLAFGMAVLVGIIAAGCSGGNQQMPDIDVTFKTQPDPLKVGENTFEAMVMVGGQPVTDAGVSVEFVMPAMPSMNMPEMRTTVPLTHGGSGRYHGTGSMAMAGVWDATVTVTRAGQGMGTRKFRLTAK
jgi:hypothetical protein